MLEFLCYQIGGYSVGSKTLTVRNNDGCLTLDYFLALRSFQGEMIPHYHAVWNAARSKRWLERWKELPCEEWKDRYYDEDILDGTQWELRYKLEGAPARSISGSNAFPDNWESFRKFMEMTVKKLPRVEEVSRFELARIKLSELYILRGENRSFQ